MNCKRVIFFCVIVVIIATKVTLSIKTTDDAPISIVNVKSSTDIISNQGYGIVYKQKDKTYIVTNNHIIEDNSDIVVSNGSYSEEAQLVRKDAYEDIAVLKVNNSHKLKPAKFNYNYHVGDKISIIDLGDYNQKLYGKIIKNNAKVFVNLSEGNYLINSIQLSIKIEEGHSGSPLYNDQNEVIGMIAMKSNNKDDIGYALDIKRVLEIAQKLEKGTLKRADLGVQLATSFNQDALAKYNLKNYDKQGVIVTQVYDSDYLQRGDIITEINGIKVKNVVYFKYYLFNSAQSIKLKVYRNNAYTTIVIK